MIKIIIDIIFVKIKWVTRWRITIAKDAWQQEQDIAWTTLIFGMDHAVMQILTMNHHGTVLDKTTINYVQLVKPYRIVCYKI